MGKYEDLKMIVRNAGIECITDAKTYTEQKARYRDVVDLVDCLDRSNGIYLRKIASDVMDHQKNYSEDIYHMFSKGVQAFLVAIENELTELN